MVNDSDTQSHSIAHLESELQSSRASYDALVDDYAKLKAICSDVMNKDNQVQTLSDRLHESEQKRVEAEHGMLELVNTIKMLQSHNHSHSSNEVDQKKKEQEKRDDDGSTRSTSIERHHKESSDTEGQDCVGVHRRSSSKTAEEEQQGGHYHSDDPNYHRHKKEKKNNQSVHLQEKLIQREGELLSQVASLEYQLSQQQDKHQVLQCENDALMKKIDSNTNELHQRDELINHISEQHMKENQKLRDKVMIKEKEIEKLKTNSNYDSYKKGNGNTNGGFIHNSYREESYRFNGDEISSKSNNNNGIGKYERVVPIQNHYADNNNKNNYNNNNNNNNRDSYSRYKATNDTATDEQYLKNIILQFLLLEFSPPRWNNTGHNNSQYTSSSSSSMSNTKSSGNSKITTPSSSFSFYKPSSLMSALDPSSVLPSLSSSLSGHKTKAYMDKVKMRNSLLPVLRTLLHLTPQEYERLEKAINQ